MPSILNSDDGVVSGTSGLKTTGGNDGLLNIQSNGSTVVAVTGSGISVTGTVSQTGVSTFAAGTVSAPSITFTGDTNTGIFSPAADTIAFTEGGAEAMRIDSSGNVLVGTTTASSTAGVPLVVARGASSYIQTTKTNATAGGAAWGTDGAEALIYTHTGTVGSETFTAVVRIAKDKSLALQGASPQTGTGITFPATQSASTDANTLDDYEEGTWTPLWTRSSSNPTYSNETANGRYTKIGNLVTVSWYFLTSTISAGGSGSWYISNLPFSSANALPQNYASIGRVYNSAEVTGMRAFNPYNTSRIEYMTVATDATYTATANGYTILEGTMSYFV